MINSKLLINKKLDIIIAEKFKYEIIFYNFSNFHKFLFLGKVIQTSPGKSFNKTTNI
jgi:hypothetical protein